MTCVFCAGLLGHALLCPSFSEAQVTNITPGGLNTALNGSTSVGCTSGTCQITGGTPMGSNLFHSFGAFSVGAGDIANFNNVEARVGIANIIGRVTGADPSNIFGTIRTTDFGTANLFLINPAGWVFGPTATLEVGGALRVSTADYIRFANNDRFYADPGRDSVLSPADPAAFGFLGPTVAPISLDGSFLQVPDGQILSVVSGDVSITGASLFAPGGRVEVASVASAGEVTFSGPGMPSLGVGSIAQLGTINSDGAFLDVSSGTAGTIEIRGGKLIASNSFFLAAGFGDMDNANLGVDIGVAGDVTLGASGILTATEGAGKGGGVRIKAGGQVQVQEFSGINTLTFGVGAAGGIDIEAGSVAITGGSGLVSQTDGAGAAGDVTVKTNSGNSLVMSGGGSISNITTSDGPGGKILLSSPSLTMDDTAVVITQSFGAGAGGDIVVAAGNLTVTGGAILKSESGGAPGGNILVTASGSVMISGASSGIFSGGSGAVEGAPAGNISLTARQLTVTSDGVIQNGSVLDRAGNISVTATDSIVVSNGGKILSQAFVNDVGSLTIFAPAGNLTMDRGLIQASTLQQGNAGNITVDVATLSLTNGAQIVTSSAGTATGRGGDLTINAANSVHISGSTAGEPVSVLSGNERSSGLFSTASHSDAADALGAGQIVVKTPAFAISDGAKVSALTPGAGPAGSISLNGTNTLTVTDGAQVTATTSSTGKGGDITLSGGHIDIARGGRVSAEASSAGNAGTVTINATGANTLAISGAGSIVSTSTLGDGDGGDVNLVSAGDVRILDGGSVNADSRGGAGLTGTINITAGNSIVMDNGTISTRAETSDGGNIKLTAPNIVQLEGSQITTSVESGKGRGGNITIDPQFVILNNSSIIANAFGGPGGNITIIAQNFLSSSTSVVEASSALSTPGTITIQSPDNNIESSIVQLPAAFLDASSLLRGLCSARHTGAPSSFVVAGRGGVPVEADGYRPSFGTDVTAGLASTDGPVTADAGPRLDRPALMFALMMNSPYCLR